jgi:hypothetical protein
MSSIICRVAMRRDVFRGIPVSWNPLRVFYRVALVHGPGHAVSFVWNSRMSAGGLLLEAGWLHGRVTWK